SGDQRTPHSFPTRRSSDLGFHHDADNLAMRQLAGRIPLNALASYLYFSAGSSVQRIVHRIKYQKGFVLADYLGFLYGLELGKSAAFRSCDLIVPVPLHKKRLRWRGYNQSEWFARGLGRALSVEVISDSDRKSTRLNSSHVKIS